jgi:hypothetical protein
MSQRDSEETYEDDVWAVEDEGRISYRLADWTPSGVYSKLASKYSEHEKELLKRAKHSDHITIGTATLKTHPDGTREVIAVKSELDGHTVDW